MNNEFRKLLTDITKIAGGAAGQFVPDAAETIDKATGSLDEMLGLLSSSPEERKAHIQAQIDTAVAEAVAKAVAAAEAKAQAAAEQTAASAKADKEQAVARAVCETTAQVKAETTAENVATLSEQFNSLNRVQKLLVPSKIDLSLGTKKTPSPN